MRKLLLLISALDGSTVLWPELSEGAEGPAEARSSVRAVRTDVELSLERLGIQRREIDDQLASIELKIGEIAKTQHELAARERLQADRVKMAQLRIVKTRTGISKQQAGIAGLARVTYALGQDENLKLLMNQEDPIAISRVLTYYRYLNQARLQQLNSLRGLLSEESGAERELRAAQEELREARNRLSAERKQLVASRQQRRNLLATIDKETDEKRYQIAQMVAQEERLQEVTNSSAASESIGQYSAEPVLDGLPTRGVILAEFGSPREGGFWDGVVIGAAEGSPVYAIKAGHVVFADWLRGYGLLAIIDHGNGDMSLYAYNQTLLTKVGDQVDAGTVIARVGDSGGRDEPALYFGIRLNGRATDPLQWSRIQR